MTNAPITPDPANPDPSNAGARRPRLAVWKFASCDGCQLTLLDCEDALLAIADAVEIAFFPEASSTLADGPYDLSLVEGSITTAADRERIQAVRRASRLLITIGACATSGGIQALRNGADLGDYVAAVYPRPAFIETLATATPIADHVPVDLELRGCPIAKDQLLEVIGALLAGRRPVLPTHSVCVECKLAGQVCVMVSQGTPCLGPVTQAGCGALCPRYTRGCYGCFGPMELPNIAALDRQLTKPSHPDASGLAPAALDRLYRTFNVNAPAFRRGVQVVAGATEEQ